MVSKTAPYPASESAADWLVLNRAPGIGPAHFHQLLAAYSTPAAILARPRAELAGLGLATATLDYLARPDWGGVEADLRWLEAPQHHLITCSDPAYPRLLRETAAAPPLLFVHGEPRTLASLQVAIVGSRSPTASGLRSAYELAGGLAVYGLTVTSGMALGIDAAGHRGALEAGGSTVAVLGTGPDRVYPARHRGLAEQIVEHGALVSEFVPGTSPAAHHFPRRNRVISALSLGTLVVEAAVRSGSLITARHAMEQNREVFAVPGSIHNPLARGCHRLLRDGAKLVETVDDIVVELGALAAALVPGGTSPHCESGNELAGLDAEQRRLMAALGYEATSVDQLVERSGLTAEQVSSILLTLELRGHVAPGPAGSFSRAPTRG